MLESKYDFSLEEDAQGARNAYRAMVQGIEARINNAKSTYEVVDISVSGCAIQLPASINLAEGASFNVQLEVRGRAILTALRAKIIRVTPSGVVACSFVNMNERQEYALDKLVLEIQKRLIEANKV